MDSALITPNNLELQLVEPGVLERIQEAKDSLGKRVLILGHHYQRDEIIRFADKTGDSFDLSRQAADCKDAEFIIFCGVHFMAESADILTTDDQKVILPDLKAGCSMADMAHINQVEEAYGALSELLGDHAVVPVTYMNSTAAIKALCGKNGGAVCTSSNAPDVFRWGFDRREKLLFLPDQHLGRWTAHTMGIPLEEMVLWDPFEPMGGNSPEEIQRARVILWKGHCSVHQKFQATYVDWFRKEYPDMQIIAHPECNFDVCMKADYVGSTQYIIKMIRESPPGAKWAVGTEHHMVGRLQSELPDKMIVTLSPFTCTCSTMYRIDPPDLMRCLEALVEGRVVNQIRVERDVARWARVGLERMLALKS